MLIDHYIYPYGRAKKLILLWSEKSTTPYREKVDFEKGCLDFISISMKKEQYFF